MKLGCFWQRHWSRTTRVVQNALYLLKSLWVLGTLMIGKLRVLTYFSGYLKRGPSLFRTLVRTWGAIWVAAQINYCEEREGKGQYLWNSMKLAIKRDWEGDSTILPCSEVSEGEQTGWLACSLVDTIIPQPDSEGCNRGCLPQIELWELGLPTSWFTVCALSPFMMT